MIVCAAAFKLDGGQDAQIPIGKSIPPPEIVPLPPD
jgi:hypothetical protein